MDFLHQKNISLLFLIVSAIFNSYTDGFPHTKKCSLIRSNSAIAPNLFVNHIWQERKDTSLRNKNEKSAGDDKNDDVIEENSFFERESYEPFG